MNSNNIPLIANVIMLRKFNKVRNIVTIGCVSLISLLIRVLNINIATDNTNTTIIVSVIVIPPYDPILLCLSDRFALHPISSSHTISPFLMVLFCSFSGFFYIIPTYLKVPFWNLLSFSMYIMIITCQN